MGMIGTIGTLGRAVRIARAVGVGPDLITAGVPPRTRRVIDLLGPQILTQIEGRRVADGAELHQALLNAAVAAEGTAPRGAAYDRIVDGLNRLPRPLMVLGSMALFGYGVADPAGFARRMAGLHQMPEQMWWLLGAVVSLFFGAREAHHFRLKKAMEVLFPDDPATENAATEPKKAGAENPIAATSFPSPAPVAPEPAAPPSASAGGSAPALPSAASVADNPALAEWLRLEATRG